MTFKHILVAVDGSAASRHAAGTAIGLASQTEAEITFVNVSEPWSAMEMAERSRNLEPNPAHSYESEMAAIAKQVLDSASELARRAGVTHVGLHIPDQRPADGILSASRAAQCDLIVIGTHGRRGIAKLLLGSQAAEVLAGSTVPVMICR